MRFSALFFLTVIAFCSCGEPISEKRVYTEKDIEGYWATNNAINGTEWLDTLSSAEGGIECNFLRFYNDANGVADTVYKVNGDTILLSEFDFQTRSYFFTPRYTIAFVATDRLILKELKSGVDITYYSLYETPSMNFNLDTVRMYRYDRRGGVTITNDSVTFEDEQYDRDRYSTTIIDREVYLNGATDPVWFQRIKEMYARLTAKDILLARSTPPRLIDKFGDAELYEPRPNLYTVEMTGERGLEILGSAAYLTNPVIRAINAEVQAAFRAQARE